MIKAKHWFLAVFFSAFSTQAFAYQTALHFYVTYVMAMHCGLEDQAYAFAWAANSVDRFPETNAGTSPDQWLDSSKVEDRRLFHFAITKPEKNVERGSAEASQILADTLATTSADNQDPIRFGIGLHVYQDSWSHEGYGDRLGHIWTFKPDFPEYDPTKALGMVEATWLEMNEWSKATKGEKCAGKFSDIVGLFQTWLAVQMADADDVGKHWREYSLSVTHHDVTPYDWDHDRSHAKLFLAEARNIKKSYGNYDDDSLIGGIFDRADARKVSGPVEDGGTSSEGSYSSENEILPPGECP